MAIDVYSLCPGGTGKKIKFCCSDLITDLQKIEKMIEGEQYHACLSHIDRQEQKTPDRACLMAYRCELLLAMGKWDEYDVAANAFVAKHPDNPVANAEKAVAAAVREGASEAMIWLQKSMAVAGQDVHRRVYEMLGLVGRILMSQGYLIAARAVLSMQAMMASEDSRPIELLVEINTARELPLWAKDERRLPEAPADAPWKREYQEALAPSRHAQWSESADRLMALVEKVGDQPAIWRAIATLRAWTANDQRAIEALRKYRSLDVPQDDAVEAETLAMYLSEDAFGDHRDLYDLEFAVQNVEQLQLLLASSPRVQQVPFNPAGMGDENSPPPRAIFVLYDRPESSAEESLSLANLPRTIAQCALYGKQTDREARLEVLSVPEADRDAVKAFLSETGSEALGGVQKEEASEKRSATDALLAREWRMPRETTRQQFDKLAGEHEEDAILNRWPKLPLGVLDGKTPEEAAKDEAYRIRLLAAIAALEFEAELLGMRFDFNRLRAQLGLPLPEPIDPEHSPIDRLPLVQLARVMPEKLDDETLLNAYRRAIGMNAVASQKKFAEAIIDRQSLAGKEEYFRAFATLARIERGSDKSIEYVERGRQAAKAANMSCASWDIMELSYRIERFEVVEAERLIQHLSQHHTREPGVLQAVQSILMQYGLIGPGGAPARMAAAPPQAESLVVPGAEQQGGGLWTPEGQTPSGEKPKLWTPGMD